MGHAKTVISLETEHFMHEFMSLLAWIANTLLFIASGIIIFDTMTKITATDQGAHHWTTDIGNIFILYLIVTVVRAAVLALFWILLAKLPGYGFNYRTFIILLHGALRGAVRGRTRSKHRAHLCATHLFLFF